QGTDDVHRFAQPCVAGGLVGPRLARDVLVDVLAAAERGPEPAGEELADGCDRLRDDRRMRALPGRRDDAERQPRGGERGAEPTPGVPRVALALAPGGEVVGAHGGVEADLLGVLYRGQQFRWRALLVRGVEADDGHAGSSRSCRDSPDERRATRALRRGTHSARRQTPDRRPRKYAL